MKKKSLIFGISIILILSLFILTGCNNEKENKSNSQNNKKSSENVESKTTSSKDVINEYFKAIENGDKTDEYIGFKIYYAMLLAGEYHADYEELYNALSNLDKGADYITENYKEFSDAMLKEYNQDSLAVHKVGEEVETPEKKEEKTEITDTDIEEIKENLKTVENSYREQFNILEKILNSVDFKVEEIEKTEDIGDIEDYKAINENLEFYNVSISFEYENDTYNAEVTLALSKENNRSFLVDIVDFSGDDEDSDEALEEITMKVHTPVTETQSVTPESNQR